MRNRFASFVSAVLSVALLSATFAQSATFDVVSIKRNPGNADSAGIRRTPDGGFAMTNMPISGIIRAVTETFVRDVVGLPRWATTDRFDIVAKAPEGTRPDQRVEMTRAMFVERMQLVFHIENQERETFALVMARDDRRLGPSLTPSSLDCSVTQPTTADPRARCGVSIFRGSLVSGGITIERLALSLPAGGTVVRDRTGLEGTYAVELSFSPSGGAADPNGPPEIFTAIQEQLGLKLVPERTQVPVLVVDRIERPSEN